MSLPRIVERHPRLTGLLVLDDRLYRPLRQLLGGDMIWSGSEGNRGFEEGRTSHHWHADRPGRRELGYLRIKVMIYLDPMRKEQGAFRVIPGSHLPGFHELLQPMQEATSRVPPFSSGSTGPTSSATPSKPTRGTRSCSPRTFSTPCTARPGRGATSPSSTPPAQGATPTSRRLTSGRRTPSSRTRRTPAAAIRACGRWCAASPTSAPGRRPCRTHRCAYER